MIPTISRIGLLTALIKSLKLILRAEIKKVTMVPKQKASLHLHPCTTVGIITEGTITFQIEGQPVEYLKVGGPFYEPENMRFQCLIMILRLRLSL